MKSENRISVLLPERFGNRGGVAAPCTRWPCTVGTHLRVLQRFLHFRFHVRIPKVSSKWYGANYRTKVLECAKGKWGFLRKCRSVGEKMRRSPAINKANGAKKPLSAKSD